MKTDLQLIGQLQKEMDSELVRAKSYETWAEAVLEIKNQDRTEKHDSVWRTVKSKA